MRVRRREHEHRVYRTVFENGFQALAQRKAKARREVASSLRRRTECVSDLDAVLEIDEAFRVGRDGHAEADDAHPKSHRAQLDCRRGSSFALFRPAPSRRGARAGLRPWVAFPSARKGAASWTPT